MDDALLDISHLLVLQILDPELPVVGGFVFAPLLPLGMVVEDVVLDADRMPQLQVQLGRFRL